MLTLSIHDNAAIPVSGHRGNVPAEPHSRKQTVVLKPELPTKVLENVRNNDGKLQNPDKPKVDKITCSRYMRWLPKRSGTLSGAGDPPITRGQNHMPKMLEAAGKKITEDATCTGFDRRIITVVLTNHCKYCSSCTPAGLAMSVPGAQRRN
jgi:hypothetical protein